MKNLHFRSAIISSLIIYLLAISAFIISYLLPFLEDPDLQANLILSIFFVPIVSLGAHLYYRKGHHTNGFILGLFMFLIAILLDALVTVPLFIIPNGGDHFSFFVNFGFWLLGIEYVSIVVAYWRIGKAINRFNKT